MIFIANVTSAWRNITQLSFPRSQFKGPGDVSSEESLPENDWGNICGDVDRAEQSKLHLKLIGNLLDALRKKYLPHHFVTSYNLFCYDYIESNCILETLAEKVDQIIENPIQFAEKLVDEHTTAFVISEDADTKEAQTKPASLPAFAQPHFEQQHFSFPQAIASALAGCQNPHSSIRPKRSKKRGGVQNTTTDDIQLD